ncbi:MAG: DUF2791 family P-loop domain-containing protein [Deltaproteobacteria bacterium]|nr:DUF2791 family P-loop domain-containing protein [Deltaproteobacteria bacterium]
MSDIMTTAARSTSVPRERVRHPLHGAGEVRAWRRGGRDAVVAFDGRALPIEVPARELSAETPRDEGAGGSSPPAESARFRGTRERELAMRSLEAMRLGVVPSADLSAYTVGRQAELDLVDADLARVATQRGCVRAWFGDYGTGKTHLLEMIQQRALSQGFLTTEVTLDQEETSPAHPKRVYRSLVRGLRYPDRPFEEGAGLEPLFDRALATDGALEAFAVQRPALDRPARLRLAEPGFHLYLTPALSAWQALSSQPHAAGQAPAPPAEPPARVRRSRDLLMDWLEGLPTVSNQDIDRELGSLVGRAGRIYSLLDYRPWSRIFGYLVSGIAALARAAGYQGLVVLFDEAEFYSLLSRANREFARHLFIAWSEAASGDRPATASPASGSEFAGSDEEIGVGGYGIMRELPAHFDVIASAAGPALSGTFYLGLAMTPNPSGEAVIAQAVPEPQRHALAALSADDYQRLCERVCDFYASAWPDWTLQAAIVPALSRVVSELLRSRYIENPRQAMKFIVEFLDIARSQPEGVAPMVRKIQSSLLF